MRIALLASNDSGSLKPVKAGQGQHTLASRGVRLATGTGHVLPLCAEDVAESGNLGLGRRRHCAVDGRMVSLCGPALRSHSKNAGVPGSGRKARTANVQVR